MRLTSATAPLALALCVVPAAAQSPTVKVRLSFSVKEFDPAKPGKAVVRCVVRNDTMEEFEVPTVYDGRAVVLRSGRLALERPGKPAGRKPPSDSGRRVRLEPRQERVVFELPLADVLPGGRGKANPWRWVWDGKGKRPAALPRSPLEDARGAPRGEVEFECDVYFTGGRPVTGKAALKVARAAKSGG
jgi:hypothetical protein